MNLIRGRGATRQALGEIPPSLVPRCLPRACGSRCASGEECTDSIVDDWDDCANIGEEYSHAMRGGSNTDAAKKVRAALRASWSSYDAGNDIGVRCARVPATLPSDRDDRRTTRMRLAKQQPTGQCRSQECATRYCTHDCQAVVTA